MATHESGKLLQNAELLTQQLNTFLVKEEKNPVLGLETEMFLRSLQHQGSNHSI